ncbi:porphobilinogen deaminase [Pilimelia anulata]|uniref:Porphobilinogen deaminase n=1 Tax=Pilimelia anulata TaxID=53371 RepID=A0A8J3BAD0_9ACTN|nr:hydroxymethylbilane synthase [Pilimelia anulata]GGJ91772.1 porphobilinogen deaminase [Pilimelia anulata]
MTPLRLGTRGSALALAQAEQVADALRARTGRAVELIEIGTTGDRSDRPVPELGVGVFVSALREALLAKEIDFAVHSYKDLPSAPADGLIVAAVPQRQDPRDALIARDGLPLSALPPGARVGTGAVRRVAQLHALGLQLDVRPIRGNVDTRLRRVAEGELDAVVLARAGLARLGRADEITESLDPMLMLPAPAQGALAVECRSTAVTDDDADLPALLRGIDDLDSRLCVAAERALLATLEAGCSTPIAALAVLAEDEDGTLELYLRGAVISPDGARAIRLSRTAALPTTDPEPAAAVIGRELAADLRDAGADDLLAPGAGTDENPQPGDAGRGSQSGSAR